MKVILWLEELQPPLMNDAINVIAKNYGALDFVGAIPSKTMPFTEKKRPAFLMNGKPVPIFLSKKSVSKIEYDIVLVGGDNVSMPAILERAKRLNIDADKVVLDRTVCVPGFTLEKYQRLRHSNLSILSRNCWGGLICHLFGLPFLSPIVNMFFIEDEYIRFLHDPRGYLGKKLKLLEMRWQEALQFNYPVFLLDDVQLLMNHYNDVDVARAKWEERCRRINWDNLLVMMYTERRDVLEEFDKLPFEKKACFVPFESDLPSAFYVDPRLFQGEPFWKAINSIATGNIACFDLWDLLLDGKKTPIDG